MSTLGAGSGGVFDPQIVRKRQRRFEGLDDTILALYARGMSTRDIEAHLQEIYGSNRQRRNADHPTMPNLR